jgi:prephenate dehydrogenase
MTAALPDEIYLLGTGLIGGSLALDLKKAGAVRRVVGFDQDPGSAQRALEAGIIDQVMKPGPDAYEGRLVVLAIPVARLMDVLKAGFPSGTLVTDVGSVKGSVMDAARESLEKAPGWHFVPGHPIAGDEKSGPDAARTGLFDGARVILTPEEQTPHCEIVELMWRAAGANVVYMDPVLHDSVFGWVSHLPHMAAYAIVDAVMRKDPEWVGFSAGGLRDYTRIAASSPRMWADIAVANRQVILEAMSGLKDSLQKIESLIRDGDRDTLEKYFHEAAQVRRKVT